jgi:hypothetical protein
MIQISINISVKGISSEVLDNRITEDSDTRITEDGNKRITEDEN